MNNLAEEDYYRQTFLAAFVPFSGPWSGAPGLEYDLKRSCAVWEGAPMRRLFRLLPDRLEVPDDDAAMCVDKTGV
jgi:hypothetical protein